MDIFNRLKKNYLKDFKNADPNHLQYFFYCNDSAPWRIFTRIHYSNRFKGRILIYVQNLLGLIGFLTSWIRIQIRCFEWILGKQKLGLDLDRWNNQPDTPLWNLVPKVIKCYEGITIQSGCQRGSRLGQNCQTLHRGGFLREGRGPDRRPGYRRS